MQDLNHMVWIETDVELELFHVARMFCRTHHSGETHTDTDTDALL